MKIAFMGTPEFAVVALEALMASEHEVVCVVSQPDRKSGRGRKLTPPPVAAKAIEYGLPLLQPETVGTKAFRAWLADSGAEVAVVVAFGKILGPKCLATLPGGFFNIHASLLPRWRGASPIQAALLAGDSETGVTIIAMNTGLDAGPMVDRASYDLKDGLTATALHDALATLGGERIVAVLDRLAVGELDAVEQDVSLVTYAPLISKSDGMIDWSRSAVDIERQIRAFHPWPGTRTEWHEKPLKVLPPVVWVPDAAEAPPGQVVAVDDEGFTVATGAGGLCVSSVQPSGKRPMAASDFVRGHKLDVGARLGRRP